ncbi:hypothetical protein FOMPIDRAFT_1168386 [Fomitopsis schrenkii]|uniref:F-box domain-containing protein n=1 Tax=Fomitopsis schrenkii TaxID=2126942 RepID=S8DQS9_FOMSC|nr:hypothetical protein FOMPIDRAFT_1168386 [Fomitopsis schrenkii]
MIPVLFRTVALTTSRQINAFKRALLAPPRPASKDTDAPASPEPCGSYVRHLWFGPNDRSPTNILQSPQLNNWPVGSIRAILPLCTALRSLAISNFPEEIWCRISEQIPPSVEALHLGSVRAYMQWDWTAMPCFARLRTVTSMELDGVWAPRMYKTLATAPNMRVLRRFFPPTLRNTHRTSLQRAAVVPHADGLDRVEIIGCMFLAPELAPMWLKNCAEAAEGRVGSEGRGRFVLRTVDGTVAWKVFFEDWVDLCARV